MHVAHQPDTKTRRLSPEHEETIKETLPVVGAHIGEITPLFYNKMFAKHPELIKDTFNRGNQQQGEQQKALAASIAVFASMLVDPNAPDPVEMLSRIAHKHVSLGITKDQYQIVHDNLFEAIVEVLGEAVTPEVAAAWDAVYWLMTDVLVDFENDLYASAQVEPGDVFRRARLMAKEQLTDSVSLFTFESEDLGEALPGQYTSIGVRLPDGARQLRQYSLVSAEQGRWVIAVEQDGEVSTFLHQNLAMGEEVDITLPAGDLVLQEGSNPVVLISQGIGSTPMVGMLAALQDSGREVVVLHADESADTYAQRAQTQQLAQNHHEFFRSEGQRLEVAGRIPSGADVYLCGGSGFLQNVRDQIAALPEQPAALHFELFSPNDWLVS
ncbi:globin domain-containing protein [Corynebacterium sp. H128]|uniref:globin domain-containing protein n=1 Tax=unclassified Corynebacterium TaxID=2624378 RepID=UPI0030980642